MVLVRSKMALQKSLSGFTYTAFKVM